LRLGKTILIGIAQKAGGYWPHERKAGDAVSPMTAQNFPRAMIAGTIEAGYEPRITKSRRHRF